MAPVMATMLYLNLGAICYVILLPGYTENQPEHCKNENIKNTEWKGMDVNFDNNYMFADCVETLMYSSVIQKQL